MIYCCWCFLYVYYLSSFIMRKENIIFVDFLDVILKEFKEVVDIIDFKLKGYFKDVWVWLKVGCMC